MNINKPQNHSETINVQHALVNYKKLSGIWKMIVAETSNMHKT